MTKTFNGLVMGVGSPQDTRKNGKTICSIVLSEEIGFFRVYRIPADLELSVWSEYTFTVERGSDSRPESWRFLDMHPTGFVMENQHDKRDKLDACILKSGLDDPIDYQNETRQSIALVKLEHEDCDYLLSGKLPKNVSDQDDCSWLMTQGKHWMKPMIQWKSHSGKTHKTHLGGREVYEYLRKYPETPFRVFENLGFGPNPDFEHWMLLGNQAHHRNVFLCVHMFRLKKQTSGSIPLFSSHNDGRSADWPYLKQGAENVKTVGGQATFNFTT